MIILDYKLNLFQKLFSTEEQNFLHLNNKKILDDFDYLYTVLKQNSPLVCVAERNGLNFDNQYKKYREKISRSNNNFEQITLIYEFSKLLPAHNGLFLGDIAYWYKAYRDIPNRQNWSKILSNESTIRNHKLYFNFKNKKKQNDIQKDIDQEVLQNNNIY
ncbi:hypothetical protein [Candidatus Endomicrobiellum cubanum]|jgi:hypothetical protein|uniref:hypothetical protein n=1 Tax=Candidatus Endomicrobiellum cubanum TaxID=3242325 RepID=UPI003593C356